MKFIAAILIIVQISLILANEEEDTLRVDLEKYHKECITESKVDPQVLKEARAGNVDINNHALVEHIFCVAKKLNIVKDNKLDLDVIKNHFEKQNRGDVYKKISEKCKSVKSDDVKLYTAQHLKCSYQNSPKEAILV